MTVCVWEVIELKSSSASVIICIVPMALSLMDCSDHFFNAIKESVLNNYVFYSK